jgi:CubicO group peptidase (beta-lactamase class C family)
MRLTPRLLGLLVMLPLMDARAQTLGARLDSAMRAAEARGFSGVVRVERSGSVLLEKGYGLANRVEKIPFAPSTVVQIGSNTKDFTAVSILQLQQAGRLSLSDTLGKYFPGAPPDKRGITLRQIMNHRAGFPLGLGGDFERVSRQALVDSAMHYPLLFQPGSRESYSNTGYSLLAAIIEQLSGKSYDAYIHDTMLAPLGLKRTGFLLPRFAARELAHGYLAGGTDNGTMLAKPHAPDGPYWNLRGNGGMLSTVGDMHAFYAALFDSDKLLTRAARGDRFPPDEPIGLAGSDGVNFFLYDREPQSRTEMIIASTNAAQRAPAIRRALGAVLGLPNPDLGGEEVARRPGGRLAPAAIDAVLRELVAAINTGDSATVRRFIAGRFTADPGTPSLEERVRRMSGLHERLGALTVQRVDTFDQGPAEITLDTAVQGPAVIRVNVDRTAPYKIHGLQIQVGGSGRSLDKSIRGP